MGGAGGTGGSSCTEYGYTELVQACKGNCGLLSYKCSIGFYNCAQIDGSNACGKYQFCNMGSDHSGTCVGCTLDQDPAHASWCTTGTLYVCPPGFPGQPGYPQNSGFMDHAQDYGETDVDCGGPNNPYKCPVGKTCAQNSDCQLQACAAGACVNSSKGKVGCDYATTYSSGDLFCCPT